MSNQPENEMPQPNTMTPQELREALLAELEAGKQIIAELSDEQMEAITGGALPDAVAEVHGAILHDANAIHLPQAHQPSFHPDGRSPSAPPSPTGSRVVQRLAVLPVGLRRTRSALPVPDVADYRARRDARRLGDLHL